MKYRLTVILALVSVLLGLVISFWDRDNDTARARLERARRAFRFDPARVDRLLIESGDLSIECRLQGRQWRLVRPIAARADSVAIERLLGALQELPRGDIILPPRRSADAYAPYGLDHPRARISIIEGVSTNRILIGRRTPLGDGVYVRQSDHAGLARLNTSLLALLPASADALRDRSLLSGTPSAIERLDIRSPVGYIQLARDGNGDWRLFQPFSARAESATLSALLDTLLSCSVVQFVQDAVSDLSPYGLDSRSAVTAVLNTDSGDGSQMLSLGDPLPHDPSRVYARLQAETSVYAVPLAVRQALLVRPDDLRDRRIPGTDPDFIQGVRIEEDESVLEFTRASNGTWQLIAPLRTPAEPDAILALLRSWADVRLIAFENPGPTSPPVAFSRTIRITPRNAKIPAIGLRLGANPEDAGTACLAIDGDSSIAIATPSFLLDFPIDPLLYRSRDIFSIPADDIASIRFSTATQSLQIERESASGQWVPAVPGIDRLLAALSPLRAESLLSNEHRSGSSTDVASPYLTLTIHQRGQSGLSTTLLVGDEITPGGLRRATVRGRDLVFAVAPGLLEILLRPRGRKMKSVRIHLDAHAHIYPFHDVPRLLLAALDHMPRIAPTDQRVLCLSERADCSFFQSLAQDEIRLPGDRWRIAAWDSCGGVKIRHLPDHRDIWVLAGRQIISAERIEVCSLFSDEPIADGLPAREIIQAIRAGGGLPALDWAPGKWLFGRGQLVRALVAECSPAQLLLIDTSLRPFGWPAPRLYGAARRQGRAVLAGSDPLPFADEEEIAGSYHCTFQIPSFDDPARLVAPLKAALTSGSLPIEFGGHRGTPLAVLRRLRRNAQEKKKP